jgi:hypothetical protein
MRASTLLRFAAIASVLDVAISTSVVGCGSDPGLVDPTDSGSDPSASEASAPKPSGTASTPATSTSSGPVDATPPFTAPSSEASLDDAAEDASYPDVQFVYDAPVRSDALAPDAACATTTATATRKPLDMFVMLDRSGSMGGAGGDCNVGDTKGTKWCRAINALSQYFTSSASTGNAAAIQDFPRSGGTCGGGSYASSSIPGGTSGFVDLPSTAFDTWLNAESPTGGNTPTEGAIRGLTSFTADPANRRPGHAAVGILITDGDPNGCNTNLGSLSTLLSDHYGATGVRTFVIGMTGASDAKLETLAAGGNGNDHPSDLGPITGTCGSSPSPCKHWNVGDGTGGVLAEALQQIAVLAIGCTYPMPTAAGGIVDPARVSVEYVPGGAGPATPLVRVPDASSCVPGAFYYDSNTAPTELTLCPDQCAAVQADPAAKVDVLLGCLGG